MEPHLVRINLGSPEGVKLRAQYGIPEAVKEMVRVFVIGNFIDEEKDADGQKPVMITTDAIDRMGEIVDPKGIDLTNYKKNPVILWAHSYHTPPIGSAKWVRRTDAGIMAMPRFADTQFAQEIKSLYDGGHMKAWSIGFIPLEWEDQPREEGTGKDKRKIVRRIYTKSELLEFSAVPVPANPEALSLAMSKGFAVSPDTIKQIGITVDSAGTPINLGNAGTSTTTGTASNLLPDGVTLTADAERIKNLEKELGELKARLVERDQEVAGLKEQVAVLEKAPEVVHREPTIRIIGITRSGTSAVIRIDGAPDSLEELQREIAGAVDGRMKRWTGRVS